jgi:long-subunit acyl-CoA synthetase (AMP-forming)
MRSLFDAMDQRARRAPGAIAMSDGRESLTGHEVFSRARQLAAELSPGPRVVGLLAGNGVDWALAQIAGAFAGKLVVPVPTFFSAAQIGHICRDASIEMMLTTPDLAPRTAEAGIPLRVLGKNEGRAAVAEPLPGFGQLIYTSGSTGNPKGVRHESGQVEWSSVALARAIAASSEDVYLSLLPLPLLLETICAVFVPSLVGARVHFETGVAEAVGRGRAPPLVDIFERHRPTTSVLVPQLLRSWVAEQTASGRKAPETLRFVAVGGAPVPDAVAHTAWFLGIPVHEGYGLSECCSVVSVNRPGERTPGTAGRPLDGLSVWIDEGEIVVDGPSVTDGYLGQPPASRPWRTGDLGQIDETGALSVLGRKDNLIVTSFGRNISPEWIETMLLSDERIAVCAVSGHGEDSLTVLIIPTAPGVQWFDLASRDDIEALIADCCASAPAYAVPRRYLIVSATIAGEHGLITPNGRVRRSQIAAFVKQCADRAGESASSTLPSPPASEGTCHGFL